MSKFIVEYDGTPSVSHTIIAQNTDNEVSSVTYLQNTPIVRELAKIAMG